VESAADQVRYRRERVNRSDVDLLRDLDRVIDLDAEIPDGRLDFRMTEQELYRTKISCSAVDQHRLRPTKRVRAELRRVKTDAGHPLLHEPSVLPCGQTDPITSTGKQELASFPAGQSQVLVDRLSRLVSELEPNRSARGWDAVAA